LEVTAGGSEDISENDRPMQKLNSVTGSDTVDSDTEDSEVTAEASEDISESDRPMPNLNSDMVDSGMVDSDTEGSEDITENDRPKLTSSVQDLFALMFLPHQQSNFVKRKKIKRK
jgi:hypothetical protein